MRPFLGTGTPWTTTTPTQARAGPPAPSTAGQRASACARARRSASPTSCRACACPRPAASIPLLFPRPVAETWLEIGFGGGEHLAAQARLNPGTGIIGCEPFVNGVVKLLRTLDDEAIDTVRLWDRDAMELLPRLPDASIGRVFLLLSDPWPKRRQRKRSYASCPTNPWPRSPGS